MVEFKDIIYNRASQDFYRLGITNKIVSPSILFQGDQNSVVVGPGQIFTRTPSNNSFNNTSGAGVSASKFVNIALAEVGVKESGGQNRGPRVREFQSVTNQFNAPWCASFVTWCLKQSGVNLALIPDGPARVNNWRLWAETNNRITTNPQPGDLFFWINPGPLQTGHIGIVVSQSTDKPGKVITVEGNTDSGGAREGDGVYKRIRPMGGRIRFISMKGIV